MLRVSDASMKQKHDAVDFFISQLGKPYDVLHFPPHSSKNSKNWYCSELAWAAYKNAGIDLIAKVGQMIKPSEIYSSNKTTVVSVSNTKQSSQFTDIKSTWAKDCIIYLTDNGILAGTSETTFSPYSTLNRAMVVSVLYRLEGCPSVASTSKFSDVTNNGLYYYDAVNWASSKGIVAGYEDGTFKPTRTVTREELVTFMYRYAKYKGYSTSYNSTVLNQFTDRNRVSNYAQIPMKWAVSKGIISGTSTTTISPQASSTREQAAAIFYRFIKKIM